MESLQGLNCVPPRTHQVRHFEEVQNRPCPLPWDASALRVREAMRCTQLLHELVDAVRPRDLGASLGASRIVGM